MKMKRTNYESRSGGSMVSGTDDVLQTFGIEALIAYRMTGVFFGHSVDCEGPRVDRYIAGDFGSYRFDRVVSRPSNVRRARQSATRRNRNTHAWYG